MVSPAEVAHGSDRRFPQRWERQMLVGFLVCCLAGTVGACRGSQAAHERPQTTLRYDPSWLSPDGRLLLVDSFGPLVIDAVTGTEVWQGALSDFLLVGAAWSPGSDALAWIRIGGPETPCELLYCPIPGREPTPVDITGIPGARAFAPNMVAFGRSPDEVVLAVWSTGLPRHRWTAYWTLAVDGAEPPMQAGRIAGQGGGIPAHWPRQLFPVRDGSAILIADGSLEEMTPARGLYLLDLGGKTLTRVVNQTTPAVAAAISHEAGASMDLLKGVLVPETPGRRFTWAIPVVSEHVTKACEMLTIEVGDEVSVERLGPVAGGIIPAAPVTGNRGFVVPIVGVGSTTRPLEHYDGSVVNLHLLDPQLQNPKQLTDGLVRDDFPVWSEPAGRVLFRRDEREIWSVSLAGGDAKRLWPPKAPEGE